MSTSEAFSPPPSAATRLNGIHVDMHVSGLVPIGCEARSSTRTTCTG
jgi:hypothetical protein